MASVVTKTGDRGDTGLFGGRRVSKDDVRLHAYGTVDELNACLGVALAEKLPDDLRQHGERLQHVLFRVGSDLATPADAPLAAPRVRPSDVVELEGWIAELERTLPEQHSFLLPGGTRATALLHVCRTVCRRAEREAVSLSRVEEIHPDLIVFLNRLSDYFFVAARHCQVTAKLPEIAVRYE